MVYKRATIRDVAREAGVSYQTVSRVINNQGNVSLKTKLLVDTAVEKLGFRINRPAQIMQTGRSNTIEVILFYTGFNMFLYEMARVTQRAGYHFVLSAVTDDEFEETLASAASRFIDGLVFLPDKPLPQTYEQLNKLCNGIPFVQVGAKMGMNPNLPCVLYNQKHGARLATEHLIHLGHRAIAEISGPLFNQDGSDRHEAWLQTMREHGLDSHLSVEGDYSIESGYRNMRELLNRGEPITAIFVGNDLMAFGAHTALREHGLSVPRDISIVGFDDIAEAAHFVPSLTTVRQDFQLLGRLAVEQLINRIENPTTQPKRVVLEPELIIRESTRAIS